MPRLMVVLIATISIVSGALVGLGVRPAAACSCSAPPGAPSQLDEADAVFVGTVVARRDLPTPNPLVQGDADWTFAVERVVKGTVGNAREEVRTGLSSPSCGYVFEVGARYAVFARRVDGRLTTSLCSGTDLASQAQLPPPPTPPATPTRAPLSLTG